MSSVAAASGSQIDPQMGAHRGRRSEPVEMWIMKGNLQSDADPQETYSIGENFWHVRPVVAGHKTLPVLAHHAALSDYQHHEYLAQEQSSVLVPGLTRLKQDHLDFKVTYGLGGDVHHPATFLKRLCQIGQHAHAERTDTGITIDAPLADGGKVHLDLTPETKPMWWKIQMGHGHLADLMAFPMLDAHGTIERHGVATQVHGELYGEQILGDQDLKSSYRNLTWFFFDVDKDTRVIVYDFTDKDGNQVTPQVKLCHRDGTLEETNSLRVTPEKIWKSPSSGHVYGTQYRVEVPDHGIVAEIHSRLDEQEVPGLMGLKAFYYGGIDAAGTVNGKPFTGQGYTMQQYNDTDVFLREVKP